MLSLNAHVFKNTVYTNHSMLAQPMGYHSAILSFVHIAHFRGPGNANKLSKVTSNISGRTGMRIDADPDFSTAAPWWFLHTCGKKGERNRKKVRWNTFQLKEQTVLVKENVISFLKRHQLSTFFWTNAICYSYTRNGDSMRNEIVKVITLAATTLKGKSSTQAVIKDSERRWDGKWKALWEHRGGEPNPA